MPGGRLSLFPLRHLLLLSAALQPLQEEGDYSTDLSLKGGTNFGKGDNLYDGVASKAGAMVPEYLPRFRPVAYELRGFSLAEGMLEAEVKEQGFIAAAGTHADGNADSRDDLQT